MKVSSNISVHASDHAILRYLERQFDLDINAIRRHLTGKAISAAQLGAIAVQINKIKLILIKNDGDTDVVTLVTVLPRNSGPDKDCKNG